jgi:nucleotide-binding universal stress UspA family protein
MPGPILFCYDGSDGSRAAIADVAGLLDPTTGAVVLTAWEPTALILARSAPFGPVEVTEDAETEADAVEAKYAAEAAEEGAKRARDAGWEATARAERAEEGLAQLIVAVADEIDASLIVCGSRGRGPIKAAVLGSVSHALVNEAKRPVLVAPGPVG